MMFIRERHIITIDILERKKCITIHVLEKMTYYNWYIRENNVLKLMYWRKKRIKVDVFKKMLRESKKKIQLMF